MRVPSSAFPTALRRLAELLGFAVLLFVTRYVLRGHLALQMDQECHIGGIAVEVLAHGVRFPLVAYAPNEYDNGSFYSGLLAALSFGVFGRSLLALKLVTHLFSAAGAVATLALLRRARAELGLTGAAARWTSTLVLLVALALAPRVVTMFSMYAVGNHAEGAAWCAILLAAFATGWHRHATARTVAFWALVGFALYLNKGVVLVLPVLAAAEWWLAKPAERRRLAAAAAGFALGMLPELLVIAQQIAGGWGVLGWSTMVAKNQRNVQAFPRALIATVRFLGEQRPALLLAWGAAIAAGTIACLRLRPWARPGTGSAAAPPVALALVVATTWAHVVALSVMAKSGLDAYVIYGYPTLVVLLALAAARLCDAAERHGGVRAGWLTGAALLAVTLGLYRPQAAHWEWDTVRRLAANRAGAACAWRFAEGFEREQEFGLAPAGVTREQWAIRRCRSLGEPDLVLDCIGGIARELHWRQHNGRVAGAPPAGLTAAERRAYAWLYGTHRKGRGAACTDFTDPALAATCADAVALECLHYADLYTRIDSGDALAAPRCAIAEPPFDGYWAARRREILAHTGGRPPDLRRAGGDDDLAACRPVFLRCYGDAANGRG